MPASAGFWNDNYTNLIGRSPKHSKIDKLLAALASQGYAELIETMTGAAVGGTASRSYTRVKHVDGPGLGPAQGGAIQTETRSLINRVTVAADETKFEARLIAPNSRPAFPYPVDLSGNGGGGKIQR